MKKSLFNLRFLQCVAALFFFLGLATLPAHSQSKAETQKSPIVMQLGSPFAFTTKPLALQVRQGRWFPVGVTLTNSGQSVKGTLTLKVGNATTDDRYPTEYSTAVDLPTNARKRVWLYGRIARSDASKFTVTLSGRGFKTQTGDGILQVAASQTRLLITISDADEKLAYLANMRAPGLGLPVQSGSVNNPDFVPPTGPTTSNGNTPALRPLGATHEWIPSRWIGLEAADMVILHDFPHAALSPNQLSALRGYVAAGGALLVLGGANWQRLSTSPLADLWPVTPESSGTATAGEVSTLFNRYARFPKSDPGDTLSGAPVVLTRAKVKSNGQYKLWQVRIGTESSPLIAKSHYGAGQVLFLAFDPTQPPFLGWRGLPRLFADLFNQTAKPQQIEMASSFQNDEQNQYSYNTDQQSATASDQLLETLKKAKQLRTPPVSQIAWFLALYVFFLVPVNYVVLRYFDRRELAWITIPVIVLIFSVVSYGAALRIKGTAILTRQVNVVQTSSGSPAARGDAMLWLFSPRKTTYDISSKNAQMVVADYRTDSNTGVTIREPEENEAFALDAAPINMWDWRSFVGQTVVDMKGGVRVAMQKGQPVIVNNSPFDLKGAVLVSNGILRAFGTVKVGATAVKSIGVAKEKVNSGNLIARIRSASNLDKQLPPVPAGGFADIPDQLLNLVLADSWSTPSTFLVAWSEKAAVPLTIGREDARAQSVTLFVVDVPTDRAIRAAISKSSVKKGDEKAQLRTLSSDAVTGGGKTGGALTTYEVRFENSADAERGVKATMQIALQNRYGYYSNNQKLPKKGFVPAAAEYFDFAQGAWKKLPLFEINKKAVKTPSNPPGPDDASQNQWQFVARLNGSAMKSALQLPDGRLLLRVRTFHDDLKVQNLRVVASQ